MLNRKIAKILYEMAVFYEIKDVPFKPRAYKRASFALESSSEDVEEIYKKGGIGALTKIEGIGKGIASHIEEVIKTGHFKEYERLKKKIPVDVLELMSVGGIGPKMVGVLWEELKIKDLAGLKKAAEAGKISKLKHFGARSEKNILRGIEFLKKSGGRRILGHVYHEILEIEKAIKNIPEVLKFEIAGSVRRMKETVGDLDLLVISNEPVRVMEKLAKIPQVSEVFGGGPTKMNVKLTNGMDADLRVVPGGSFGAALNYFTGSKDHNIALREIAIKKGYKLNEYGLFKKDRSQKWKMIAGSSEEDIYRALGLVYIEPELREKTGEIEAAKNKKLPKLVGYGDLKGDLQIQTDWTDGKNSIEEMAFAARDAGLEYIVITDHTKSLAMTGGSDEKKLTRQMEAIDKINKKFKKKGHKIKILKGAEVNIMKDGTLDINDETLKKLDVVGAAAHSYFDLPRDEQTKRIIRAMENPNVDIIFHPTGRVINRREAMDIDMDKIISAARRTKTILEIDAYPDRLDLHDGYVRKCVDARVKMCIDTDAHSADHFKFLKFGIAQARRGWATKNDIINAWPLEKMLNFLK